MRYNVFIPPRINIEYFLTSFFDENLDSDSLYGRQD